MNYKHELCSTLTSIVTPQSTPLDTEIQSKTKLNLKLNMLKSEVRSPQKNIYHTFRYDFESSDLLDETSSRCTAGLSAVRQNRNPRKT